MNDVILVDEQDNALGTMDKLQAHQKGVLHRAFSIFIFNDQGQMLIQQRAFGKYHSGGLWTNACCSHPLPGETLKQAAKRRLQEEMGFSCELKELCSFIYREELDNNMIEHELDHVFSGEYNDDPKPDPLEVAAFKWISMKQLQAQLELHPEEFTVWFKVILDNFQKNLSPKII